MSKRWTAEQLRVALAIVEVGAVPTPETARVLGLRQPEPAAFEAIVLPKVEEERS